MNSDQAKVTVQRWLPLARGVVSGMIGWSLGLNISRGQWLIVALDAVVLVALWAQPFGDVVRWRKHDRSRKCTLCGERPMWLYSLIPPPAHADRLLNRHLLHIWTVWSACEAHDARVRQVVEQVLRHADCGVPDHDHADLRLYGVSSRYMKLGVK